MLYMSTSPAVAKSLGVQLLGCVNRPHARLRACAPPSRPTTTDTDQPPSLLHDARRRQTQGACLRLPLAGTLGGGECLPPATRHLQVFGVVTGPP